MINKTVRHLYQGAGNERPVLPLLINVPALLQAGHGFVARALVAAQRALDREPPRLERGVASTRPKVLFGAPERGLRVMPLAVYPAAVRRFGPDRSENVIPERRAILRVHALCGQDREAGQKFRFLSLRRCTEALKKHAKEYGSVARPGPDDPLLLGTLCESPQFGELRPREQLLNSRFPLEGGEFKESPKRHLADCGVLRVPQQAFGERPAGEAGREVRGHPRDLGPPRFARAKQLFLRDVRHF